MCRQVHPRSITQARPGKACKSSRCVCPWTLIFFQSPLPLCVRLRAIIILFAVRQLIYVTELRNHLPGYLGRVKSGEDVAVSSRGKVIERLVPEADE